MFSAISIELLLYYTNPVLHNVKIKTFDFSIGFRQLLLENNYSKIIIYIILNNI